MTTVLRNLSSPPAFGWETSTCNADQARINRMRGDNSIANKPEAAKTERVVSTIFKLLGVFFPVIGLGRIVVALAGDDANQLNQVARGIAELCGAGVALFFIDLVVTVGRSLQNTSKIQVVT